MLIACDGEDWPRRASTGISDDDLVRAAVMGGPLGRARAIPSPLYHSPAAWQPPQSHSHQTARLTAAAICAISASLSDLLSAGTNPDAAPVSGAAITRQPAHYRHVVARSCAPRIP